jgi:hypothetical protein
VLPRLPNPRPAAGGRVCPFLVIAKWAFKVLQSQLMSCQNESQVARKFIGSPRRQRRITNWSGAIAVHGICEAKYTAALIARTRLTTRLNLWSRKFGIRQIAIPSKLVVDRNARFLIPKAMDRGLIRSAVEDLTRLEIWPDGLALQFEMHHIHVSVHGLVAEILSAVALARTGTSTRNSHRSSRRLISRALLALVERAR